MGETDCYALVRGSSIRVTNLSDKGFISDPIRYAVSKAVAKVQINEVTTTQSGERLGSDENDNDIRVQISGSDQTLYYTVDIDFLRVDPGVLSIVTGALPTANNTGSAFGRNAFGEYAFGGEDSDYGFGELAFGEDAFGMASEIPGYEDVVGFDSDTRRPPVSFALEVWSKLAGAACEDGTRQYGYTVFPHLRGGYLTGFAFSDGLVSFNVRSAKTRRAPKWGVGPYDLSGPYERLLEPVSRNTLFRQTLTSALPPLQVNGVQTVEDVIDGTTTSLTPDDIIDGGSASAWIIDGGS